MDTAPDFDETELYDRQIRLWGVEAQQRIQNSRVLMYGLGGLSAEVCKNLCLAGISATIVDAESVTTEDLSSNFFLSLEDVGTNRVVAALPRIKELNKHVSVEGRSDPLASLDDAFILQHNIVFLTHASLEDQVRLDELCRANGVAFFAAEAFGYEALLFVDLGAKHTYRTESGAGAASKLSGPCDAYYPSLAEALAVPWPELVTGQNKRFGPVSPVYTKYRVLKAFQTKHGRPATAADAEEVLAVASALYKASGGPAFSTEEAQVLAATATAELAHVCAILGGVIGQEVVKFVSGKGSPVENFFVLQGLVGEGKVFRSPPKPK